MLVDMIHASLMSHLSNADIHWWYFSFTISAVSRVNNDINIFNSIMHVPAKVKVSAILMYTFENVENLFHWQWQLTYSMI